MERPTEELLQRMLAAVVGTFGDDERIDRVVESARAEAEAEVKDLLKSAIKATLLQRAVSRLEASSGGAAEPQPVREPAAPTRSEDDGGHETACYVYGITRAVDGAYPPDLPGVDGRATLHAVAHGRVQAVTSEVSLADFGADAIGERLKDLEWVERSVRAHDRVVKALVAAGAVVPCRFCTILRDEQEVRRVLARHEPSIVETLDALEGRKEWGVKITADLETAAMSHAPAAVPDGEGGGKAYFLQKQRDDRARGEANRAIRAVADECHRQFSAVAAAATLLKTRDRTAGGRREANSLLLNGAYLVADAEVDRFHGLVTDLSRRFEPHGLSFELTGPWPPYNFVSLDLSLRPDEEAAA